MKIWILIMIQNKFYNNHNLKILLQTIFYSIHIIHKIYDMFISINDQLKKHLIINIDVDFFAINWSISIFSIEISFKYSYWYWFFRTLIEAVRLITSSYNLTHEVRSISTSCQVVYKVGETNNNWNLKFRFSSKINSFS